MNTELNVNCEGNMIHAQHGVALLLVPWVAICFLVFRENNIAKHRTTGANLFVASYQTEQY